jgi:hypothetical protein
MQALPPSLDIIAQACAEMARRATDEATSALTKIYTRSVMRDSGCVVQPKFRVRSPKAGPDFRTPACSPPVFPQVGRCRSCLTEWAMPLARARVTCVSPVSRSRLRREPSFWTDALDNLPGLRLPHVALNLDISTQKSRNGSKTDIRDVADNY